MTADPREVTIERIGAQGDGVAATTEGDVFIPFGLPGERWRIAEGAAPERLSDAAERCAPICAHFGTCGGCSAQHMAEATYRDWKHGIVTQAFSHRGISAEIAPLRSVAARSRRRAFFGVARHGKHVRIGFREAGDHTLVDLTECPVLHPAIADRLDVLRRIALAAMPDGASGRLIVTAADNGLDVAIETGKVKLSPEQRATLAGLATAAPLARLTIDGDAVALVRTPALNMGGAEVHPTSDMFLQAVPEAETVMRELVVAAIGKARRIVDLFSGAGTFTFALARRAQVLAVDSDRRALAALTDAARRAQGLKRIETKPRDLFREPLSVKELEGFDAAVIDPPRAGAKAQAEMLARSKVPLIVAVSCNPATLARDVRILIDGGYALGSVVPVDQFLFSPHVEAVAALRR